MSQLCRLVVHLGLDHVCISFQPGLSPVTLWTPSLHPQLLHLPSPLSLCRFPANCMYIYLFSPNVFVSKHFSGIKALTTFWLPHLVKPYTFDVTFLVTSIFSFSFIVACILSWEPLHPKFEYCKIILVTGCSVAQFSHCLQLTSSSSESSMTSTSPSHAPSFSIYNYLQ
jgi:hypothetical protein